LDLTGLHQKCADSVLSFALPLLHTILCVVWSARHLQLPIYLHCTSGRHRSVAIGSWLSELLCVPRALVTLPAAAPSFKEDFEEAYSYGVLWQKAFCQCAPSIVPVIAAPTYAEARHLGRQQLEVAIGDGSKSSRKRERESKLRFVDFRTFNVPVAASFSTVDHDVFACNAFNLIDFMELPVPMDFLAFNHQALVVVEGNLDEQLKHLKFFQVVDETNAESFSHLRVAIEDTMSRTISPIGSVELDTTVLNAASSAGVEFARWGFGKKGTCVLEIERRACDRLAALRGGQATLPGLQTPGGRGKRMHASKLENANVSDALGRLIRVAGPDDVLISSSILNALPLLPHNPTALGFSFFGSVEEHLTDLRLWDPTDSSWVNVLVVCPDFVKMDSSVKRGLTELVMSILFTYLPAVLFGGAGGVPAPVLYTYFLEIFFGAFFLLQTLKVFMIIHTGLSSGNTFVSFIESILASTVARRTQERLEAKFQMSWPKYEQSLGDDIIFTVGTDTVAIPTGALEAELQQEVSGFGLVMHPFSKKGKLGYGPLNYHFLSRMIVSATLTSRELNDTLGAACRPEKPTVSLTHTVLRFVGLACDAGLSPALGPLLLAIRGMVIFIKSEGKNITGDDIDNVRAQAAKQQYVWSFLAEAGVTSHVLLPLLTETPAHLLPTQLALRILNLHVNGSFTLPYDLEGMEEQAVRGFLGVTTHSTVWSGRQVRVARLVTSWLLREAGLSVLPVLVLTVERDSFKARFERRDGGGKPEAATGRLSITHGACEVDDAAIIGEVRKLVEDGSSPKRRDL